MVHENSHHYLVEITCPYLSLLRYQKGWCAFPHGMVILADGVIAWDHAVQPRQILFPNHIGSVFRDAGFCSTPFPNVSTKAHLAAGGSPTSAIRWICVTLKVSHRALKLFSASFFAACRSFSCFAK